MKSLARCYISLVFVFLLSYIACESVVFDDVAIFKFNSLNLNEIQSQLCIDDTLIIKIDEEIPLLKGMDIEVDQNNIKQLCFFLYSVLQFPNENEEKYSVKEITKEELHKKKCFTFRFAYNEKTRFSSDPTIKLIPYYFNEKNSAIAFKFSSQQENSSDDKKLNIRIKPILQDIGAMKFNFLYPSSLYLPNKTEEENKSIVVRVDDKYVKDFSKPFFTRVGQHKVQVESPFYKSEVITCVIEKGKTEIIDVQLKSLKPLLIIEGPSTAEVYLNETLIKLPFYSNVQKGEHILRFKMEGYEIVRNINLEDGKTYNLYLSLEVKMVEN